MPAQVGVCLAFSDECPCHFCCPKFHLHAKVALLWKRLHRKGREEFLGEQAKTNAAVSLLQGCVAPQQHLAYTGWGYLSFQTWVTQAYHYRQDPMFKHFPSRSGFGLCASGVAFINQNGGIGSCFQEFIISTVLERGSFEPSPGFLTFALFLLRY